MHTRPATDGLPDTLWCPVKNSIYGCVVWTSETGQKFKKKKKVVSEIPMEDTGNPVFHKRKYRSPLVHLERLQWESSDNDSLMMRETRVFKCVHLKEPGQGLWDYFLPGLAFGWEWLYHGGLGQVCATRLKTHEPKNGNQGNEVRGLSLMGGTLQIQRT